MHKFDKSSKIVVLDGSLAVGKTSLASDLADKMGMKYFPECHAHYLDERAFGPGEKRDPKFSGMCNGSAVVRQSVFISS